MLQTEPIKKKCFVCGQVSKQRTRKSTFHSGMTGPSGIVELDGRPVELTETILKRQLDACPYCGYIAQDIGERTAVSRDFLKSPDYCRLQNPGIPPSSSRYMRAALIQLEENNLEKAAELFLAAAWCTDHYLNYEIAASCRQRALSLIFAGNRTFADLPPEKWVPVLDTMRQCRDFDTVISRATDLLPGAGPALQQDLEYEISCAQQQDSEPHTNCEAANFRHKPRSLSAGEELVIGGKPYCAEDDCYGTGWNWVAETRTLVLSSYHGPGIEAYGDITIHMDKIENQIVSSRGPGILVHDGNLKISGSSILSIQAQAGGIVVDNGTFGIARTVLVIRTNGYGILAQGTISVTDHSILDVSSETIAVKSASGGLISGGQAGLIIHGACAGLDLAGDTSLSTGAHSVGSADGCGILVRHGSLTCSSGALDFAARDACIRLGDGDLILSEITADMNGSSCAEVHGSCSILSGRGSFLGTETGFLVSMDMSLCGKYDFSGKNPLSVGGDLQIEQGNVTASGETGISVGGDLHYAGRGLVVTGDTAMEIGGNTEITDGQIMASGRINGIVVHGSYTQLNGDVCASGGAGDGIRIAGKMMRVGGGSLSASGRDNGLVVAGHAAIDSVALLSASGNTGFSVGKSLKFETGNLVITGTEIGLSVGNGNLITGITVTLKATGNVGIYAAKDIGIHGGRLQVTGKFCGIICEKGNLIINAGILEIGADEYGLLLQSGSMKVLGGIFRITGSRMKDEGGCGIVIEKGRLDAAQCIMTINGGSYGISVPCGDISLAGKFEVFGFRAGISGRSLALGNVSITLYGKNEGAVVLSEPGSWSKDTVVIRAGKSGRTSKDTVYSGQRYLHAYTVHGTDGPV